MRDLEVAKRKKYIIVINMNILPAHKESLFAVKFIQYVIILKALHFFKMNAI